MGEATTAPRTIAGRYHVERAIGRGGMGTVWLCRDELLQRDVAIKQIGTLPGETGPDLARAMREARSSAALHHPHVVSIYDVVEESDHIWLVMEYVESRTLAQVVAQDGALSPEAAVAIGSQIAGALAATHAAGTIHRDVKPGNILVTSDGVAKISDFGIARAHDQDQLTRSGLVIGTPTYFSPELARGEKPTPACDVWALGASLFAAVEGHPPYEDQPNALALLATIASSPPAAPRRAGFLTEPIERMLDPDPAARWSMSDAAHVLERLRERHAPQGRDDATSELSSPVVAPAPAVAEDAPTGDEVVVPAGPVERRRRRGPGTWMVLALTGLLVLAAVVGALLLQGDPAGAPSATDPKGSSQPRHSAPSTPHTSSPTSTSRTPSPSGTSPTSPSTSVRGGTPEQLVRSYYAALPSDTRAAWSSLSPRFQAEIGGYGDYRGFWSTISDVEVTGTSPVGEKAVDVSLTYTSADGGTEREVRRLFLEPDGTRYLIDGDQVVG